MKQKNFKKFLFYHVGLLIIQEFCLGCKTYHFLVKSIQKSFPVGLNNYYGKDIRIYPTYTI
jgi:hypothetical protein